MKEWSIRLLCIVLGVVLTLGTTKIVDYVKVVQNTAVQDDTEYVEETESLPEGIVVEEEKTLDYELEAQQKYEEMIQNTAPAEETVPEEEQEIVEVDPWSIESAPVKWKSSNQITSTRATLEENMANRSSYDETMATNAFDKMIIENSTIDFSDVKITIMGDSLTAGSNLSADERGEYNWPSQLQKILGCKEVVNLGIGGSSVSSCLDSFAMCERWTDIEADSDIIIIMGGSNDMLVENIWQFGSTELSDRGNLGTFCGDLDDMYGRIKWVYVDHNEENYCRIICINPPSTILNDGVYDIDPERMVKQEQFAEAINVLAMSHSFDMIDLYNNNILNSHDPDINREFVYDGIHCNKEGYRILAEHVASQIIQRIEQ